MPSLKEVRGRIQSVNSTQQITKAMKMVAAAKLRRSQDAILQMRPYSQRLSLILQNISASIDDNVENPYAEERAPNKILLVVVTSDRGLAGAFNSNVMKATNTLIAEKYNQQASAGNVHILAIGRKGFDFYNRRGYTIHKDFVTTFSILSFGAARKAAEFAMDAFVKGDYDKVEIVYNEFKNVATQIVRVEQFLPIIPAQKEKDSSSNTDYIYEPSKEEIFQELIPKSLKVQFYKTLLESNASENGARMMAMDKATENAKELIKELRLVYNRSRQAAITKEILEIVGGAEALSQG
ncbi:ATP synthase F1 subunit gamma [Cytophagaceae bacterium YF14B1]|uniref:ATP synthase gamma chain n=1 Tax=Xanthocytophaga flava TaxID=3048013 RepID=A0AAE3QTQ4_9BACT|nr:ATP synthase F1 subunit gamma [Xanthocytophaga flavus]MDJ1485280.1 ATP synthase F1 subunit gamma [Xanthocytophaga flavus]